MLEQPKRARTLRISLEREHRVALQALKNSVLTMLGIWIAYFLIINFFIQQLDRIVVPVIDLPLGIFLVIQGGLLLFVAALYLLVRPLRAGP